MKSPRPKTSSAQPAVGYDWDDAKVALTETGSWIKNADTKVTILAAVLGVSITTLASRSDVIVSALKAQDSRAGGVLIIAVIVALISGSVCIFFVGAALRPRVRSVSTTNRFSWPALASLDSPPVSFPSETRSKDAWEQTHALSQIAKAKYRALGRALFFFLTFVVSAAVVLGLAIWLENVPS
jgi:hypothetical protein